MSSNGAHIDQVCGELAGRRLIVTVGIWGAVPLGWEEDEREVTEPIHHCTSEVQERSPTGRTIVCAHSQTFCSLTHRVDILKHFVHPNQLIVELVVSGGVGQECVPIRDEQVEDLHHLRGGGGGASLAALCSTCRILDSSVYSDRLYCAFVCAQTSFAIRKTLNLGSRCSSLVTKNLRRFNKAAGEGERGGKLVERGK